MLGKHVLGFLATTVEHCLMYEAAKHDHGPFQTLQVPRHDNLLEAFSDVSFAPQGGQELSGCCGVPRGLSSAVGSS